MAVGCAGVPQQLIAELEILKAGQGAGGLVD